MRSFTATFFLVALAENLLVPDSGGGLTIYRIGGSDMDPPPEAGMEGVEFVPLSWEGAAQGFDGQMQGLTTEGEQIAPLLITPDDNVMLGALARGGGAVDFSISGDAYFKFALLDAMTDGDPATTFNLRDAGKGLERYPRNVSSRVLFDLGTRFPINRVRMYPDPRFPERYVEEFAVMAVVGPLTPRLFPGEATEVLRSETANRNSVVDVTFPRRNLAQLLLHVRSPGLWEIAEFEVYGDGYVPEATYRSAVLDLGGASTLGPLRWIGFRDRDARVKISTRSGLDEDPNRYWRFTGRGDERTFLDEQGQPLTRTTYESLSFGRSDITPDLDHWSAWSGVYDFADSAATAMVSSSPRRFLQLQVEFVPKGLHGGGLEMMEFRVSQPPVSGPVVGEIWPVEVEPAAETSFVYALRPELGPEMTGFDQLVLETSGKFTGLDSVWINQERADIDLLSVQDQRLVVGLPRMGPTDNRKLVEVFFRAQVYYFGTMFQGQVFDSERPLEVGQLVEAEDATQLWVGIQLEGGLLRQVGIHPPVITPNGDGINDQAHIEYTVLKLAGAGAMEVAILDLSGRRVRQVYQGRDRSGRHGRAWDGRGEDERVVVPGFYIYQVQLDADEGREERNGLISVVY